MQWDSRNVFLLSLSFAVLLFCSVPTLASPEETSGPPPSPLPTSPPSPLPMPSLPGFADNWASLRQLVDDWGTDSENLLNELQKSQAIADGLTRSLTESRARYLTLESLLQVEREAARLSIQEATHDAQESKASAGRWRWGAIIAGAVGVALGAVAVLR